MRTSFFTRYIFNLSLLGISQLSLLPIFITIIINLNLAHAYDGHIYITGMIVDSSCVVTKQVHVTMQDATKDLFKKIGDASASTDFGVELSQCPDIVGTANLSITGFPSLENSELLQTTGDASGVAIELLDQEKQRIPLVNGVTRSIGINLAKLHPGVIASDALRHIFHFSARYVSTAAVVTSGSASAILDFTVTYQ